MGRQCCIAVWPFPPARGAGQFGAPTNWPLCQVRSSILIQFGIVRPHGEQTRGMGPHFGRQAVFLTPACQRQLSLGTFDILASQFMVFSKQFVLGTALDRGVDREPFVAMRTWPACQRAGAKSGASRNACSTNRSCSARSPRFSAAIAS